MAAVEFDWEEDSLTDEEKRLIEAYSNVGKPVDDLAYTQDFDKLVSWFYGEQPEAIDNDQKHQAFRQLLNLRKRGRLPRLVRS